MLKHLTYLTVLLLLSCGTKAQDKIPDGWIKAGSKPKAYEVGIDEEIKHKKEKSAYLSSTNSKGFGTLMQTIVAREYLGKKVQLSAYIRSEDVKNWAGLWLRVDAKDGEQTLSFDNMQDRPIKGTTDWTRYQIVLEVPTESGWISYGALLDGNGKIWMDEFNLEVVDKETKISGSNLQRPYNTDFEF